MSIPLLILSTILFIGSFATLFVRDMLAPILGFLALLLMWLSDALPLNSTIIIMWLCITAIVTCLPAIRQHKLDIGKQGSAYLLTGAFTGMVVGLLGVTFTPTVSMLYGIMIVATVAGTFFGFMLFSNTPAGKDYSFTSGKFFEYLLAKGFPTAITVMQAGIVLTLLTYKSQLADQAII